MSDDACAQRISALRDLIEMMVGISHPAAVMPVPPALPTDPAQLAKDSADSAIAIAHAVAALGLPGNDDQASACQLWTETLAQIARIQQLHGLPAMPFQSRGLPEI